MKKILLFFLYLLITEGVSVSVPVKEGDSVTLHTDLTEIMKDVIEWRFGAEHDRIARINKGNKPSIYEDALDSNFRGRLKLNSQTKDLTITNIKTTDSGVYDVSNSINTFTKSFNVTVSPADAVTVMEVTVMEGDKVTLQAAPTDMQKYYVIQWRFKHQNSLVAEINGKTGNISQSEGGFRDRLQLDQTGSLTIKNIGTNFSGIYEVDISSARSGYTTHYTQSFNVTVSDDVKSVSVTEGDTVTLHIGLTKIQTDDQILWKFGDHGELIAHLNDPVSKKWNNIRLKPQTGDLNISRIRRIQNGDYKVEINTRRMILHRKYHISIIGEMKLVSVKEGETVTMQTDTEIQKDDLIQWMYGDIVIAEINKAAQQFFIYDGRVERFRDRLELDRQTGSLAITNTRTTDYGLYNVKISSSRRTINRRFIVTVIGSGLSPGAVGGIGVGVILVAAVGGVVIYYRKKISKQESRMEENGQNHKAQDTDDPANEVTKLASSNL